jgi:esterase/lipase superfamily enzyme
MSAAPAPARHKKEIKKILAHSRGSRVLARCQQRLHLLAKKKTQKKLKD